MIAYKVSPWFMIILLLLVIKYNYFNFYIMYKRVRYSRKIPSKCIAKLLEYPVMLCKLLFFVRTVRSRFTVPIFIPGTRLT